VAQNGAYVASTKHSCAFVAKLVGNVLKTQQNLVAAPSLKASMYSLIVLFHFDVVAFEPSPPSTVIGLIAATITKVGLKVESALDTAT
jgi:hypothetical protein